ncbi:hypothetical protein [Streptacidiphilus melanogenes]|uniref:hypothetical protein n=1 Tax=Streptacidiphilus melanogenes TaxID=411235 RepID=UPI0005A7FDBA|nr:hypothetical protein [Streptacidiphilus melanogenes]
MSAAQPQRPTGPYERRRAGLLRVRRLTRWTVVGSAASALVLGLGYAHALPDLASLLPSHASDGGGSGGVGDFTGGSGANSGGGAQAPTLPGAGSGGSHTSTGAS